MNGSLANLARAQDELRNAVSVGLSEIKSAYETVVKDSETEHKGHEQEREQARRAIETAESDKGKLETKLTQCEEALKETKNVLMETREQAKDVRVECDRLIDFLIFVSLFVFSLYPGSCVRLLSMMNTDLVVRL